MIQLTPALQLSPADDAALRSLQQQVDAAATYPDQVALAASKWASKQKDLFQRVRDELAKSCPGARRCNYCEDSAADEIEHIRPKSWFPDQTFQPDNYLFSCGPCNSPKGNAYAVVTAAGQLDEAVRTRRGPVVPPPVGQEALLHPRYDNALDYLVLDLTNTFHFRPRQGLSTVDYLRADYTIRVLGLNKRDLLPEAREEAFKDFSGRLANYHLASRAGATPAELAQQQAEVLKKQHISVWREMQRQASAPWLQPLFALVPGADQW